MYAPKWYHYHFNQWKFIYKFGSGKGCMSTSRVLTHECMCIPILHLIRYYSFAVPYQE